MSDRISIAALREGFPAGFDYATVGIEQTTLKALVEAVEAARDFYEGDEKSSYRLRAALARFDFGDET